MKSKDNTNTQYEEAAQLNIFLEELSENLNFIEKIQQKSTNGVSNNEIIELYNINNKVNLLHMISENNETITKLAGVLKNIILNRKESEDAYILFSKKNNWEVFYSNIILKSTEKPINNLVLPRVVIGNVIIKNQDNISGLTLPRTIYGNLTIKNINSLKGFKFKNITIHGDLKIEITNPNIHFDDYTIEDNYNLENINVKGDFYFNGLKLEKSRKNK